MKIAKIWLPLLGDMPVVVRPNSDSAQLRLTFAQADARLHMWGDGAADLLEQSTRELSSSLRGIDCALRHTSFYDRAEREYPEAL